MRGCQAEVAVALEAAAAGSGRLLTVEGDAGIGKTTLVAAAVTHARRRGLTVLRARGNPLEREFAFGIARQAFAPLQTAPGWRELCRGPAAVADELLGGPGAARIVDGPYAATHGLFCLTAAVAARHPAVLFVDDAHWADVASQYWLAAVARRVDELPLTLVLALETGAHVVPELTAGTVVTLSPLDQAGSAKLVRERFPAAQPALVAACHAASGGNPYLLKVLLTHSDGHSAPAVSPAEVARWLTLRLSRMPEGCANLATGLAVLGPGARLADAGTLAHLSPDRAAACADALQAAGVLAPDDWSPANPMIASALTERLGAAERGRWHARAASLLVQRGADPERTAVHLLRAEPAGRAEVVAWLRAAATRAAGRGAPESAAAYLRRALEEPVTDPADDAAIRLELALALAAVRQEGAQALAYDAVARIADPAARAEAALRCGRALAIGAHGAAAIAVYRLALDPTAVGVSAAHSTPLEAGVSAAHPTPLEAGVSAAHPTPLEAGVSAAHPTPPDQGAGPGYRLVKDLAPVPVDNGCADKVDTPGFVDNSGGGLDKALLLARPLVGRGWAGDAGVPEATVARLEAELAGAAGLDARTRPLIRGYVQRCRERPPVLELWRVIAAVEDTFAARPARDNLAVLRPLLESGALARENDSVLPTVAGLALIANGDLETARAMSEGVAQAAGARGWLSTVAHGRFLRSLAVLPAGLVSEAVADARAAVEFKLNSHTPPEGLLFALCPLVDALVEADRLTEADALIAAAFPGEPPPYGLSSPMFRQSRGRLRWAQERPGEAIADLRAAGRMWAELGVRHPGLASWRADLVAPVREVEQATGGTAQQLAREHLALAEAAQCPGALSQALRVLSTVAGPAERLPLLQRAAAVSEGTPERLAHAYAMVGLGGALRRAGRREAARDPLRTGLEIAAAGGARRLAARATAELRAAGARPRRAALHGPAALTEAEQQVAGMAAGGLTNREIALRLVLSRRTIETHLAHAYHKLGIASRHELTAALAEEGGSDGPAGRRA